jgi:hypothetical protein
MCLLNGCGHVCIRVLFGRRPGYPHRVRGDDDPNEQDVGPWVDAPFSDECVSMRSVLVQGLLPASRYRFRYRSQDGASGTLVWLPWELAALSDWYMTAGGWKPPACPYCPRRQQSVRGAHNDAAIPLAPCR